MLHLSCVLALGFPQEPTDRELIASFAQLPQASRQQVLEEIAERVSMHADLPAQRRILAMAEGIGRPRSKPPAQWYDPDVYAPVAARRRVITEDSYRHRRVRAQFPKVATGLPETPEWRYDWGSGRIVRPDVEPDDRSRFANLLAGRPPGADAAVAAILQLLDSDGTEREIADWLGHLYADRNGGVFADITLYEAWASGQTVEVPDVDAIAFAREILQTNCFVSPIPEGRRRNRLYQQIADAVARHRQYRTLREAAAASFVAADPDIEPTYQPLVLRMHLLWPLCNFDPNSVERSLASGTRSELLEALDSRLLESSEAADAFKQQLADLATATRAAAIKALDTARRQGN